MVARTQLAALDNNFNIGRGQKSDSTGQPLFAQLCPKTTGRWTVRKLYAPKNYHFRKQMLTMAINMRISEDSFVTKHQQKQSALPKNIAPVPAPDKSDLVEAHVSRFKLN